MRVGIGYDVHRLVEGRRLVIGGVTIPFEKGLLGHSDADVLVHAVCDAILGAAGLGDIGLFFPDDDPRFKDIDSLELLARSVDMARKQGYSIINVDSTVFAQEPKLMPHRESMRNNLGRVLHIRPERINVKATTTEGLGLIGAGEGMAAMCVVLLGYSEQNSIAEKE
ncbi:MAG: 2-C-methyl-D-erythritol 2,4-cyclodiphosphate synthase [Thermodesulfobacteriota bacterium]